MFFFPKWDGESGRGIHTHTQAHTHEQTQTHTDTHTVSLFTFFEEPWRRGESTIRFQSSLILKVRVNASLFLAHHLSLSPLRRLIPPSPSFFSLPLPISLSSLMDHRAFNQTHVSAIHQPHYWHERHVRSQLPRVLAKGLLLSHANREGQEKEEKEEEKEEGSKASVFVRCRSFPHFHRLSSPLPS